MTYPISVKSSIFPEIQALRTTQGFQKLSLGDISLNLLNIFETAASKKEENISKIIFQF